MHVSDVTLLDTVNSKYPTLRFEIGPIQKYLEGGFFKTVFEICVLQVNLSKTATFGTEESGHYKEVAIVQRFK